MTGGTTQYAVCEHCGDPAEGRFVHPVENGWVEWLCWVCSEGWEAL